MKLIVVLKETDILKCSSLDIVSQNIRFKKNIEDFKNPMNLFL